jgi:homoserine O-acetyltransferase
MKKLRLAFAVAATVASAVGAAAQDYPAPKEGDWVARDFRFHTGEVTSDLRIHYTTVGEPSGQPVLILHGTTQSGGAMLSPTFAGELFGPGQPLDASKYYIVLPDILGHGKSAKPSDGLRTKFPLYNYDDMVTAQYRLVTEGLGLRHLRLALGFSMGGMQTWLWSVKYPDFTDVLVPMTSQPSEMSSRNWMMRRLIIDSIRNDPDWNNGNYAAQPRSARVASVFYGIATAGGTLAYQKLAPTREAADKLLNERLAAPFHWMPTTFSTCGTLPATTIRRRDWSASRL